MNNENTWLNFLFLMDGLRRYRNDLWYNNIIEPKPRFRYFSWFYCTLIEYFMLWPIFWALLAYRKIRGLDK